MSINDQNMDCMEMMAALADKSKNLAPVDPPYFKGPNREKYFGGGYSSTGVKRPDYPGIKGWEIPTLEYFNELTRVSENQIIWGANYFSFIGEPFETPRGEEIGDFIKKHPVGWIIWDKCNGNSSFNDYELAWTSFEKPTVIFKFMWNGMIQGRNRVCGHVAQGNKALNEKRIHPTQKPVELYLWMLETYAEDGDEILDTHTGSGSIKIACHRLGLNFTGSELDKKYYDLSEQRFKEETAQQSFL